MPNSEEYAEGAARGGACDCPTVHWPGRQLPANARRQDFAIQPPPDMLLDQVKGAGLECVSVGKIASIYCDRGITRSFKTSGNAKVFRRRWIYCKRIFADVLFTNLVDFRHAVWASQMTWKVMRRLWRHSIAVSLS
jgi:phosphopentomutase